MAWMWKILREAGPEARAGINADVEVQVEILRITGDPSSTFGKRNKAVNLVYGIVKEKYRLGGADAVRKHWGGG